MRLLLDTHTFLWWVTDDPQLSTTARTAIADEGNAVLLSAATAWEMATKHRLGKLGSAAEAVDRYAELIQADGFEHLAIDHRHALKAGSYPQAHRDPFDRMLAAQCELDRLTLLTRDAAFEAFDIDVLW